MKQILLIATILIFGKGLYAQTVVYSEDFNAVATTWSLNTDPTLEDSNPNVWYISCKEEGNGAGNCGSACPGTTGDKTLHISTDMAFGGDLGAAYVESGFGFTGTNRRAESADINTTGFTILTLNFDEIGFGGNGQDYCELFYSTNSGGTWTSLAPTITSMCCDGVGNPIACTGTDQGLWETKTFALPAACENITTLRISFVWRNVDDGIATDPSVAIDNIEITTNVAVAPVAAFTPSMTTICEADCISFTDNSTGTPTSWAWDFGNGMTSILQNPTNICYATAGTYSVMLTVTNASGSNATSQNITVNVCSVPVAAFTPSQTTICENDCINFVDNSTGNPTSWAWDFGNGMTSVVQNPTNICYATAGVYVVMLTATNATGSSSTTQNITVNVCSGPPTSAFTPSRTNLCTNDCISFADNSTGAPTTWSWDFGNGMTSMVQNPTNICYTTNGTFTVTLIVGNANGTNSSSQNITVANCAVPIADFSVVDDTICAGDCIIFTDESLNNPTTWNWVFNGGTPSSSNSQNPGPICFATPGSYNIDLTVTNANGTNSVSMNIVVGAYPVIVATGDTTIEMGGQAMLDAVGVGGTYNWVPAEYIDCPTCSSVIATPLLTTTFYAQMISPEGCITQDTVKVIVNFMDIIDVPNVFSPNGDGLNDILFVKGVGITNMNFRIYNRYGELIFTSTDQLKGWDGRFRGQPENPGVFLYILEYTLVDDTSNTKNGSVTLIK